MRKDISLSVVVLAFDEEAALERVVLDLLGALPGLVGEFEILVVDDGSRDGTPAIAAELSRRHARVRVLTHERNLGLPLAAKTGYREARCEYVIWIEGDGQFLVGDLGGFIEQVPRCAVVASRRDRSRYSFARRCVSVGYNFLLNRLFGLGVSDAGSVIMVKKGLIDPAEIAAVSVAVNAELLIRAKRKGCAIGECRRTHVPRRDGESHIFGVGAILRSCADLWRLYWRGTCSGS